MQVDTTNWSGEGPFTQTLIDSLCRIDEVAFLRVEDAPATRAEAGYNFISNEVFVAFRTRRRTERVRRLGLFTRTRSVSERAMTLRGLETALAGAPAVGSPDFADGEMLQYLRTERVVPPYQSRGYKLVELVRIYEVGAEPRR